VSSRQNAEPKAETGPPAAVSDDEWAALRSSIWRNGKQPELVRVELLRVAGVLSPHLTGERRLDREWAPLGVEVRTVAMTGRGSCSTAGHGRTIYVNRQDGYELQRFTVAHEIGHLLLVDSGPKRRLHPLLQEKLCDAFASALLIPAKQLDGALDEYGLPPAPADLVRLCGRFRVNVRPMLFTIGERLEKSSSFLLLARYCGHRLRPQERAFRVIATAGASHAYFPPEQRLVSLGLHLLAERGEHAAHGESFEGYDSSVTLGLRGLPGEASSDSVDGVVAWRGFRAGKRVPYIVAVMDLAEILANPAFPGQE
jgi:uncharacterized protein DUF955